MCVNKIAAIISPCNYFWRFPCKLDLPGLYYSTFIKTCRFGKTTKASSRTYRCLLEKPVTMWARLVPASKYLAADFSKPLLFQSRLFSTAKSPHMIIPQSIIRSSSIVQAIRSSPSHGFKRFNSKLPESVDDRDPLDNSFKNRLPKFPFHKEAQPTLIPKADTPRVTKTFSFPKLMATLKSYEAPELLYMAESHRLYIISCFALSFIVCYNIYDLLERSIPAAIDDFKANRRLGTSSKHV